MNWGRVFFVFFCLLSLTMSVAFLYENNIIILFLALSMNFLCATLRIGVKNVLAPEILATSLVAILHLSAGFLILQVFQQPHLTFAVILGAVVANVFCLVLLLVEAVKHNQEEM